MAVYIPSAGFDEESDTIRQQAAEMTVRSGARKVKWNTGAERDEASLDAYGERLARWVGEMPGVQTVCECHHGLAMDDPEAAPEKLFAAAVADLGVLREILG